MPLRVVLTHLINVELSKGEWGVGGYTSLNVKTTPSKITERHSDYEFH